MLDQLGVSRETIEDFLFHEAQLLDDWLLQDWAALFETDAMYEVTSPAAEDPANSNPKDSLFLIADGLDRIRGRANRLLKKTAHAEYPHSKTRHMVSNIRRLAADAPGEEKLRANFVVFRTKDDKTSMFMGEYHYRLRVNEGALSIFRKRAILDLNSLYAQGRLSIIL
jgi:p-cumate 2,3-dioxygenase beta subunit